MCLNIGTLKTVNFPFGTNGKLMVLGVPILKHFRVYVILILLNALWALHFAKRRHYLNESKLVTAKYSQTSVPGTALVP